jgi:hypothetical protein
MEGSPQWFSATVRLVALIEGARPEHAMECVHVFRSDDWEAAFARALELGRSHEQEYTTAEDRRLQWRLEAVLTLDLLRDSDLDGAEVCSRFVDPTPGEELAFGARLEPERSTPTQTL